MLSLTRAMVYGVKYIIPDLIIEQTLNILATILLPNPAVNHDTS
jgi:hypothetical protein